MKVPEVHTSIKCPTCKGAGSISARSARDGKSERLLVAWELRQSGHTYREIAELLNIQPSRAFEIVKEARAKEVWVGKDGSTCIA